LLWLLSCFVTSGAKVAQETKIYLRVEQKGEKSGVESSPVKMRGMENNKENSAEQGAESQMEMEAKCFGESSVKQLQLVWSVWLR